MENILKGRLNAEKDPAAEEFNRSLDVDKRLYRYDIAGSIAHAEMLAAQKIISPAEGEAIVSGLKSILADIESSALIIRDAEDIHMFIESELTRRTGAAGGKLHTARSRNDQIALDMRLYVRDACDGLTAEIKEFITVLTDIAAENLGTVMCGYTHLQKAQPVTLAHYLAAYAEMLLRDAGRFNDCRRRADLCPLGSGAIAGTTFPIDRALVAEKLGFAGLTANSMDAVSDRDYMIEFTGACALSMMHLSRMAEEFILWSSGEFGFLELDDKYTTTSSMMPQKKNPDMAELIRGKTGRVYGDLTALLTLMKGLPLTYNKDMQEDKESVFHAHDTLLACLGIFRRMTASAKFNREKMADGAREGYAAATDIADYLACRGVPFRTAHEITGRLTKHCVEKGKAFSDLTIEEYQAFDQKFGADIYEVIKTENMVSRRSLPGGPAPSAVKAELASIRKQLGKL